MTTETIFPAMLILAAFLCNLVAGFVLLFAIVVMPGIGTLSDRDFLQAFQVIDKVIQNNQPLFLLVWVGSAVILLIAAGLGFWQLEGFRRILIIAAAVIFIAGVQLPTITVNIPLNNRVQTLRLETMNEVELANERQTFETRWNRWNIIRTAAAILSSAVLITAVRVI